MYAWGLHGVLSSMRILIQTGQRLGKISSSRSRRCANSIQGQVFIAGICKDPDGRTLLTTRRSSISENEKFQMVEQVGISNCHSMSGLFVSAG